MDPGASSIGAPGRFTRMGQPEMGRKPKFEWAACILGPNPDGLYFAWQITVYRKIADAKISPSTVVVSSSKHRTVYHETTQLDKSIH